MALEQVPDGHMSFFLALVVFGTSWFGSCMFGLKKLFEVLETRCKRTAITWGSILGVYFHKPPYKPFLGVPPPGRRPSNRGACGRKRPLSCPAGGGKDGCTHHMTHD